MELNISNFLMSTDIAPKMLKQMDRNSSYIIIYTGNIFGTNTEMGT
jgi:hypothetical protein